MLSSIGSYAQKVGKILVEQDFSKWSSLQSESISDDGKWSSYRLSYEYASDTLFVKQTLGKALYAFPLAKFGNFIGSDRFACIDSESNLVITSLPDGKKISVPQVSKFTLLPERKMVLAESNTKEGKFISLLSMEGHSVWQQSNITDYAFDAAAGKLAYSTYSSGIGKVHIIKLGKKMQESAVAEARNPLHLFSWDPQGKILAFVEISSDLSGRRETERLYHYDLQSKKASVLDRRSAVFPKGKQLSPASYSDFRIADDGRRVFFSVMGVKKLAKRSPPGLQIWNALDTRIYPMGEQMPEEGPYTAAVWDLEKNSVGLIGNGGTEGTILAGSQKQALFFDYLKHEPASTKWADIDVYIQDLESGSKTMLLERFSGSGGRTSVSPNGKYISYFLDGDWWIYAIKSKTQMKASDKEAGILTEYNYDRPDAPPAGRPFWSDDEKLLLYCDQNDIWAFDIANGKSRRLTTGREQDMVYRIHGRGNRASEKFRKGDASSLKDGILIQGRSRDYSSTGFFMLKGGKMETLVFSEAKNSSLKFSVYNGKFTYVEERFDLPPRIRMGTRGKTGSLIIVETNRHHGKYNFGKAQLISYTSSQGKKLGGILHYPSDYDPAKKYPMVVEVYEKMSWKFHEYINPTIFNPTGFNVSVLAGNGYFVLRPDIYYIEGEAGKSATDFVVAAVRKAVATASIDSGRIGLIGASFGGYETNFIISQTDIFAAAVAGSGMSDFVSGYLSANVNESRSEAYRYESDQPRMGKSLFEDWKGYEENSPIRHAAKIAAPMLLWVGTNDGQVNPGQTMNMFMALRKLEKECTMLRYEGEDHAMREVNNQRDLTLRVMEWFGYYLKGGPKPAWTLSEHK